MIITGSPRISIDVGGTTVYATATTTASSTTHTFRYTVGASENDANGIVLSSPMLLNSGTIQDAGGNNSGLTFTLPTTTGILVDNSAPTISSVTPPSNGTYNNADNLDFTVTFSEAVVITGSPRITITAGGTTVYATATTTSSSTTHTFRYTVGGLENDSDGILLTSPMGLNSGTIQDAGGNNSGLTFTLPTTTGILIDNSSPTISSVTPPSDATYNSGDNLDFTVTFSEAVVITGSPRITITAGGSTVYATATTTASSTTHTFRYVVGASDTDTDGILLTSPIGLNSGTILDGSGNASALSFTLPTTTGILVDNTAPSISSVTPPSNGTYNDTDQLNFTVTFSEAVVISGSPRITITAGGSTVYATATSTSSSTTHNFRYTVGSSENDADGVLLTSPMDLNSGTIQDAGGNNSALTFTLPTTTGIIIDNSGPSISSVTPPSNATYNDTDQLNFTVTFSEAVVITGSPRISIDVGGTTVYATATTTTSSTTHNFRYTVGSSENDGNGIALASPMLLNSGTIRDAGGNDSALTFTLPTTTGVLVDNTGPTISSVTPPSNGTYNNSDQLNFTVTFSEAVVISGSPRISITAGGSTVYATATTTSSSTTHNFRYTVGASDSDTDGILLTSPMELNSGTILDAGGNASALTFTLPTTTGILIDNSAPTITSITPPSNGSYNNLNLVNFTVTFSEAVVIGGAPRIAIDVGGSTFYANATTSSSSTTHNFQYVVGATENDTNGIVLTSPIDINFGTIRDAGGNDSALTYTLPTTTGILIDNASPTITSVTPPADASYVQGNDLDFTVTFSEAVVITGSPRITITVGTTTVYATATTTSSSTTHNFRYTVGAGHYDTNGIVLTSPIGLNSGTIRDAGSNNATLTFTLPTTTGILIDASTTKNWSFDVGDSTNYECAGPVLEYVGGFCQLVGTDQVDDSDACSGFGDGTTASCGGTLLGVDWDTTNSMIRLANNQSCDGTQTNCNTDDELHSSWTPQWSSLEAYWKFNETTGTAVADSSGMGNHGVKGTVGTTIGAIGKIKSAVSGDGTLGTHVLIPASSSLAISGNITIAGWAYIPTGGGGTIFMKGSDYPTDGWGFHLGCYDGSYNCTATVVIGGSAYDAISPSPIPLNQWIHVAGVRDGTSLKVYVNGALTITVTVPSGSIRHANDCYIAGSRNSSAYEDPMNGKVDELAVWDVALTQAEIQLIHNRQAAGRSGVITSRVMDALATGLSWNTFSWKTTSPFSKELPDAACSPGPTCIHANSESSTDYASLVGSTGEVSDNNLMSGVVGLWHMNEPAGSTGVGAIKDDSGLGNHAQAFGGVSFETSGRFYNAVTFDGSTGYIEVPNSTSMENVQESSFSFSVWFQPKFSSGIQTVIAKLGTHAGLFYSSGGTFHSEFWLSDNSYIGATSTTFAAPGVWHNITVVLNNATGHSLIYLNGQLNATTTFPMNSTFRDYAQNPWQIGNLSLGGRPSVSSVDEVAMWSRALHSKEVMQLYRRGANRIKHQVRICTSMDCSDDASGSNWKGPDGTKNTYFTELNNNTSQLAMSGDVKKLAPAMTLSLGTSRYFQYRTILESDDLGTGCNYTGAATACSPELKSVTVDPAHFDQNDPTVVGKVGQSFTQLFSFAQTLGTGGCSSGVLYKLGVGATAAGATWYWWNGSNWVVANNLKAQANTAAEVNTNAAAFGIDVPGPGTIYFKAFLQSTGNTSCSLDNVQLKGL